MKKKKPRWRWPAMFGRRLRWSSPLTAEQIMRAAGVTPAQKRAAAQALAESGLLNHPRVAKVVATARAFSKLATEAQKFVRKRRRRSRARA